jgi:hypothetical protein
MDSVIDSKKQAQKAASARYYAKNKEAIKAYSSAYREAHKESVAASLAEYERSHKLERAASRQAATKDTKSKAAETARRYCESNAQSRNEANKVWREANPEREKSRTASWRKENPGVVRYHASKRRAAQLQRTAGWDLELTELVASEAADLANRREQLTGFKWHVDHVVPMQGRLVSGLHVWNNLAVIPASTNILKSNRFAV